ncbi:MAG: hypothetical protein OQK00_03290, partial [Rhodobacteraceae bacterium]|nr:hypothetical protein [Paracoccaceae bacterium]
ALLAPLLDECLRRFGAAIEADGGDAWGRGYGFGAMVATARALVLALNEGLYHVFELDLSLMGGAREGRMVFAFPDKVDAVLPEDEEGAEAVPEGESLRAGVMMAQATLDAVLAQVSMPLARLQSLEVGETIPLPPDALKTARLVMGEDNAGLPVTLGQLHGFRAVRLKLGQEQTRSPSPQEAASSPTLRDALGEEPVGAASEMVALPLDSVEVAQDPAITEPHEGSVSDVEEGLDDLDDLLGEIEAEDAAQEPLPA